MTKLHDSTYHKSVLLEESINAIVSDTKGVYVDATYGGGGHTSLLLQKLDDDAKVVCLIRMKKLGKTY